MRRLLLILGGLVAVLLAVGIGLAWTPDTDPEAMSAKYGVPDDRYAPAEGFEVRYRVAGPEGAPVLVLMHGTSGSSHVWDRLIERLPATYRIVAFDHAGHGLTGPHPDRDYGYDGYVDALDAVLATEGVERAVYIGHSLGGWIAWRDALANPDRVRALVLIGASGVPVDEETGGALGFRLLRTRPGQLAAMRLTPRAVVAASVRDTVSRQEVATEEAIDRYWELLRYPGNRQAMMDQATMQRADLSGRLGEVDVPTLLLWGEDDALQPLAVGEGFAERMPNAELIVYEGVGHLPMEEVPDEVARDVRAFLEDIAP